MSPSEREKAAAYTLEATCRKVRADLDESIRIRNAFLDENLLKQADEKNMGMQDYQDLVASSVFPKAAPQKSGSVHQALENSSYVVPMYTDPVTCVIRKNWDLAEYQRRGIPDAVFEADLKHEELQAAHCNKLVPNSREYDSKMSFPRNLSKEEVEAYKVKIDYLQSWLDRTCAFCSAASPLP